MTDGIVAARITPQGKAYTQWAKANDGWSEDCFRAFAAGWHAALDQPLPEHSVCLCEALHKIEQKDGPVIHDRRCPLYQT